MKPRYIVLNDLSVNSLVQAVNEKMKEGYYPVGGMTIYQKEAYRDVFYQSMALKEA